MVESRRHDFVRALPYARRYARALTGSQARGDLAVAESLRDLMVRDQTELTPRNALYREIGLRAGGDDPPGGLSAAGRMLLLLTMLEEVPLDDASTIVGLSLDDARATLVDARAALGESARTDVLIIEDEPIIAMDIEELVAQCGHRVAGVAHTEKDAVELALLRRPGLILADINLGGGGDGISAVTRIMQDHRVPVVFVTAYPERLLTGERVEPAFVITKPFDPVTLAIATYQAVTGGVRMP
ncbi:two-component response regulator [Ameyamaea chiangmaiensis NBRC 103196]|uniref:Response regulator n=1 Tax=Ameyamaea chiangmaiensis TaxID=442969 RepID=A0A850P540_9PROT|nr:response regulator [Ameyamaea chiangmaiensis]MBS4073664.1 response regulator [Ameyamaea chiangmaiensis]NVN39068.1 response regulator [Ameyamaea chiangmaiensis]GBQ68890.1 two-component response regulator [Ameyamaea chiangmaiensis NBRC 103196]